MSEAHEQAARELKMRRRAGMSPEGVEMLRGFNEAANDWYGWCAGCGSRRTGTLNELSRACPRCEGGS